MTKNIALSLFALIVTAFNVNAQPKITGPDSIKVGEVAYFGLKTAKDGVFGINGVPEDQKDNIRYLKALDDSPVVVVQFTKAAVLVLIAADHDENGKIQATSKLVVIGTPNWIPAPTDPVVPPKPKPVTPPDEEFFGELKAAYLVSPDEDQRSKLKAAYDAVVSDLKAGKLTTNSAVAARLSTLARNNTLTAVKKVNADYLKKKIGSTWNKAKLIETFTTISVSMEMLK